MVDIDTSNSTVFNTLIPLSCKLWLMIDSVMPSCCSRMTAAVELVPLYTKPDTTIAGIGTTNSTVEYKLVWGF